MMSRRSILGLLFLVPVCCSASSVAQVEFEQMVRSSELIFEGRVVSQRAQFDSPTAIHTYVTFEVKDVWKGTVRGQMLVLRYLGGTVGDRTMHVSDVVVPALGETGVYFVESASRSQVHPLYGWDQGRFRVVTNENDPAERVLSAAGHPVVGFSSTSTKSETLSSGTALGLTIGETSKRSQAMHVRDFKQRVLEITARQ